MELIIETEDIGFQAVDTKSKMRTRETVRHLFLCVLLY